MAPKQMGVWQIDKWDHIKLKTSLCIKGHYQQREKAAYGMGEIFVLNQCKWRAERYSECIYYWPQVDYLGLMEYTRERLWCMWRSLVTVKVRKVLKGETSISHWCTCLLGWSVTTCQELLRQQDSRSSSVDGVICKSYILLEVIQNI